MTREWFDRPMPRMPTREDIDRHTDEAYERGVQREIDDHYDHAEKRKVIPERDEDERKGEE